MNQKAKITIEFTEEQLKIKEHYDRYLEDKINEYATKIALNSIENIKQMLRNDFIYDYIDCFEDENSLIAIYEEKEKLKTKEYRVLPSTHTLILYSDDKNIADKLEQFYNKVFKTIETSFNLNS